MAVLGGVTGFWIRLASGTDFELVVGGIPQMAPRRELPSSPSGSRGESRGVAALSHLMAGTASKYAVDSRDLVGSVGEDQGN